MYTTKNNYFCVNKLTVTNHMAVIIDIAKDMVNYLSKIQNNVHFIKAHLNSSQTINLEKSARSTKSSRISVSNENYIKIVDEIAKHCFPNEEINTSREIVNFTIRKLSEGNSHKAGKLKNVDHKVYANQVLQKIYEPQQCGMFKAFSHVLISQEKETTTKSKENKPKRKYRKISNILKELNSNNRIVYFKDSSKPIKYNINNKGVKFKYNFESYNLKEFIQKFLNPKLAVSRQLYIINKGNKVSLKDINTI